MNCLITSDLHLTAAPRDEYRWRLFPWLAEQAVKYGVKDVFILGDLTESKDFHSSRLVNRIVETLHQLYQQGNLHYIHILRGNHDGIDPNCPYFLFLSRFPWIRYYATPFSGPSPCGGTMLLLPHTSEPVAAWDTVEFGDADLVFMHGTLTGAKSETGYALQGISPDLLRPMHRAKIYSGDVHVPQIIGPVEYVGAPYPVRFGDNFQPRVRLLKRPREGGDLAPPAFNRVWVVVTPKDDIAFPEGLQKGDQVKARIQLGPEEYGDWQRLRSAVSSACKERGLELCGVELQRIEPKRWFIRKPAFAGQREVIKPLEQLQRYSIVNKVSKEVQAVGVDLLKGL